MDQFLNKKGYNLEERTAKFGENIIRLCKTIEQNIITKPIISQLIRSATSVGANYMEANGASSKRDFRNKIYICKKEIQESKHWLRMVAEAVENKKVEARNLWKEAQELTLIFQKITSSIDKKEKEEKEKKGKMKIDSLKID
jgi:four helix bundle protein